MDHNELRDKLKQHSHVLRCVRNRNGYAFWVVPTDPRRMHIDDRVAKHVVFAAMRRGELPGLDAMLRTGRDCTYSQQEA